MNSLSKQWARDETRPLSKEERRMRSTGGGCCTFSCAYHYKCGINQRQKGGTTSHLPGSYKRKIQKIPSFNKDAEKSEHLYITSRSIQCAGSTEMNAFSKS